MRTFPQFLSASLLLLIVPTMGVAIAPAEKLDEGIGAGEQLVAVFVRMEDQLFKAAGDYERFCTEQPASVNRLELRESVTKTLRRKADESFAAVQQTVDQFVADGEVRNLQRYWIVNGFACEATAQACRKLAALESVDFVYRQRFAPQHRTRSKQKAGVNKANAALYRELIAKSSDDANEPFDATTCEIPWNLKRIRADRAWAIEKADGQGHTGRGVVVAVLDSGLMSIPALTAALWRNPAEALNGKDDDENGYIDDVFGYDFDRNSPYSVNSLRPPHGTLCAGIIAGRPDGHERERPIVTGIAPRAKLMPLVGNGRLRAYEYALANGADVLSMSYTWDAQQLGDYRGLVRTAHEHLSAAGVASVGGAGNYAKSRPEGWQIGTPKDIPCVIAAAGITQDGKVAAASSRGPVSWEGVRYFEPSKLNLPLSKPDVTGCFGGYPMWTHVEVWKGAKRSRVRQIEHTDAAGYVLAVGPRGNSFSGPHAAGVAALMLEANPALPVWELKRLMESTCNDIGPQGRDTTFGAGLLQADKAVEAAIAFAAE